MSTEIQQIYNQFETNRKSFPSYFTLEDKETMLNRILGAIKNVDEPIRRYDLGKKLYDFMQQEMRAYVEKIEGKNENIDSLRDEYTQLYRFSQKDFFEEIENFYNPPEISSVPPPPPPVSPVISKADLKPNITGVTAAGIHNAREMLERDSRENLQEQGRETYDD